AARLRNLAAHPTDFERPAGDSARLAVSRAVSPGASGLDLERMGRIGKQAQSEILPADRGGPAQIANGSGEVEPHGGRHRGNPAKHTRGSMRFWNRIWSSARAVARRSRMEREMDAELRFHIEAFTEDSVCRGVPREEAMRRARIEFGGIERAKEECREARGVNFVESFIQDLRYGLRMLRKSPGFTTVAVLTLALGIGANTAIFGLVDSALLYSLPFRNPERLVNVWTTDAGGDTHTPLPNQYLALRKHSQAFEQVAESGWTDNFYGSGESGWQNLMGLLVSPNWLPTLGIQPLMGRNFREDEQIAGP